jgi:hypothetical protein
MPNPGDPNYVLTPIKLHIGLLDHYYYYSSVGSWRKGGPPPPPNLGPNRILQPNGHNLLTAIHTRNVPRFVALQLAQAKNGDKKQFWK